MHAVHAQDGFECTGLEKRCFAEHDGKVVFAVFAIAVPIVHSSSTRASVQGQYRPIEAMKAKSLWTQSSWYSVLGEEDHLHGHDPPINNSGKVPAIEHYLRYCSTCRRPEISIGRLFRKT